jgi:hypothetical protein
MLGFRLECGKELLGVVTVESIKVQVSPGPCKLCVGLGKMPLQHGLLYGGPEELLLRGSVELQGNLSKLHLSSRVYESPTAIGPHCQVGPQPPAGCHFLNGAACIERLQPTAP